MSYHLRSPSDPACGTGGFLLAAHEYLKSRFELDRDQKRHLRFEALRERARGDVVNRRANGPTGYSPPGIQPQYSRDGSVRGRLLPVRPVLLQPPGSQADSTP